MNSGRCITRVPKVPDGNKRFEKVVDLDERSKETRVKQFTVDEGGSYGQHAVDNGGQGLETSYWPNFTIV